MDEKEYRETADFLRRSLATESDEPQDFRQLNNKLLQYETDHAVGRVASYPRLVFLGMTDECNALCRFCFYVDGKFKSYVVTPDDIKLMNWLACCHGFTLQGGVGEPLAAPDVGKSLRLLKRRYPALRLSSATNASLIDDALAEVVVDTMSQLTISLNATRKRTYEKSMPPLKWDDTIRNIERLRDRKAATGASSPSLILSMVVHKDNIDEMPELPELAHRLGAGHITIAHYSPQNRGGKFVYTDDYCLVYHTERYRAAYEPFMAELKQYGLTAEVPPPPDPEKAYNASREFKFCRDEGDGLKPCDFPWTWMINNHQRETTICCSGGLPSGSRPKFKPMNAHDFLDTFWNQDQFRYMREHVNHPDHAKMNPLCHHCKTADRRDPRIKERTAEANRQAVEHFEAWRQKG